MRQSNIELCRIITMLMILAVHSTYQTFGLPSGWERPNFGLILLHYSTIIGVNVFALMTGFFSLSIKKTLIVQVFVHLPVLRRAPVDMFHLFSGLQYQAIVFHFAGELVRFGVFGLDFFLSCPECVC